MATPAHPMASRTYNPFATGGSGGAGTTAAAGAAATGDLELPVPRDSGSIQCLSWSSNANLLAAGSWDSTVRIWEVGAGTDGKVAGMARTQVDMGSPVLDVSWMENGTHLFAATALKAVKLWDVTTTTTTDMAMHDGPVRNCAWVPEKGVLVTAGWDKQLHFWDCKSAKPVLSVTMPERVYSMDAKYPVLVVATADRNFHIFNLDAPDKPIRTLASPLKLQTRCVRIFPSTHFFALGSIEGRCAIRCVDETLDNERDPGNADKLKYSFAFKCHRQGAAVFPVNSVDAHPHPDFQALLATAGSDGTYAFWDKDRRTRTSEYTPALGKQPVSAARFNSTGEYYAYSLSYDWYRGAEGYDTRVPNQLFIHSMNQLDVQGAAPTAGR